MYERERAAFLAHLRRTENISPHTLRAYPKDVDDFLGYCSTMLSGIELTCLGRGDVERYVAHLIDLGLKPNTIARRISALRGFMRCLVDSGLAVSNPAALVKSPYIATPSPTAIEQSTLRHRTMPTGSIEQILRAWAAYFCLYGCGLLPSELVGVNCEDIDFASSTLTIRRMRGHERKVPFGQEVAQALHNYVAYRQPDSDQAVFVNPKGDRLSTRSVQNIVKGLMHSMTGDSVSPRALRHSYAVHLLEGGAPRPSVSRMLGVTDGNASRVYNRILCSLGVAKKIEVWSRAEEKICDTWIRWCEERRRIRRYRATQEAISGFRQELQRAGHDRTLGACATYFHKRRRESNDSTWMGRGNGRPSTGVLEEADESDGRGQSDRSSLRRRHRQVHRRADV
jgi:site-specific recombinase XerD